MSFVGCLLGMIDLLWCTLMPVLGSLHLISSKYAQDIPGKTTLLKHWVFYWICFIILNQFSGYLIIIPHAIRVFLRIATLAVLASPKLGITLALFDYLQTKTAVIKGLQEQITGFVMEKIGAKEKTA